ncbi:MAG: AsmA family protein [Desulfotignum sp.]|nr:AsmA family protein [Desulfotignum sp.]
MKKTIVLILSGLGILILLAVVAAGILLNLDPNRYKDFVAEKVSQQLGRTFEIKGDLKTGYYPWLHLEMSGVFLENAPKFDEVPMVAADHVTFRVKTLPLLRKQIEMDTIVLEGVHVNLAKDKAGVSNWEGLGAPADARKPDKPSAPSPSSEKGFDLKNLAVFLNGGVRIQDVAVTFDDQSTGKKYTVSDLNLSTGKVVPDNPVDWALTFNAAGTSPEISGNAALKGAVVFDLTSDQYQIDPLTFQAQLAGPSLGKSPADLDLACRLELDLPQDTVSVKNLQASGLGTDITGNILLGSLGSAMPRVDMDLDVTGKDLALLFKVIEGGSLTAHLAGLPDRSFNLKTRILADMAQGTVEVPEVRVNMLGASINGDVRAERIQTKTPSVKGNITAGGPDLPTLIQVAGKVAGASSRLSEIGSQLARTGQKKFHANMAVDMDLSQGRMQVPNLDIAALGISLKGNVEARGLASSDANLSGEMVLEGRDLSRLLHALNQPALGDLLDTVTGQVRFDGNDQNLKLDPLKVQLGLSGKKMSGAPAIVTLEMPVQWQMTQQRLELPSFLLSGLDLSVSGSLTAQNIQTSPEYSGHLSVARFNLRQLAKKLAIPLPETTDVKVYEKVGFETRFDGSATDIRLVGLSGVLDDTQMNGSLSVTDFANPDITVELAVDQINVDRYLPPGSPDAQGKKQTSKPVTPETVAAGAGTQIPVALLRKLKLNAALAVDDLVVSGASLSQVRAKLTAKDGIIDAAPLAANLYNGVYDGKVTLNATGDIPQLSVNSSLKGIEVEPLLEDMTDRAMLRGTGDVTAALTTRGTAVDAMKQQLNGNMSFSFKNGAFKGFNVGKFLRSLKSVRDTRTFSVSEEEETDFTEISGNPVVTNGVVVLDDLSGKSPALRISGTGTVVDIIRETIDYKAVFTVVETSRGQAGKELNELAGLPIPIYIKGPLKNPAIQPDIKGVITSIFTGTSSESVEQLKQSVEKEIGRFLKKFSE